MLTPQEVSNHAFTKAMMGGYNMAMVDEFLDELTDDYTSLYKENAALKAKLKVLVDKVEEYRSTEDAMRAALLTAQKMAGSIVQEAEKKRDELLDEAETRARERIGDLQNEVSAQQQRLTAGQQSLAEFIRTSREACEKQLAFLEELPELPVQAAQPPEEEKGHSVEEIEEQILAAYNEEPSAAVEPEEETPAREEEQNPFLDDATRTINLDDLKFGRNYNGGK
ncbi:DivIVA domain-containing protein [Oscillibacter sp. MSJ-2]|uniref:DivIVA domain-containing protein n=1 Tax=Dysosmobacter acutus TaxID=2841504 RepID=A0ABS6F6B4_9FIRM|nr:DivIVA domain-containing protein [Dysosmobacter acutus]MBU5625833.1 DivIVA domain-containing protein [Dysosmobacter acutus]